MTRSKHSTTLGIYDGLRGQILTDGAGLIRRFCVTSANVKDLDAIDDCWSLVNDE